MRICAYSLLGVLVFITSSLARGADTAPLPQPVPLPEAASPCQGGCQDRGQECCHNCGHGCCQAPCCVPAPGVKKIEKVVYGCKCVEFCVPKCPGLRICHEKDCNGCEIPLAPKCGQVRTKIVLIKKVEVKECPTCECVPPCSR